MKKIICILLVLAMMMCTACGSGSSSDKIEAQAGNKNDFTPDISIEEINWSVSNGTVSGKNWVLLSVTNNSDYTITSLELNFTEKSGISDADKSLFYSALQKSQGFDDEYMSKWIESRESLQQPITMYGKTDDAIDPGATIENIKCYYVGGWNSIDVPYSHLFTPESASIEYEKDGKQQTVCYYFETDSYEIEE